MNLNINFLTLESNHKLHSNQKSIQKSVKKSSKKPTPFVKKSGKKERKIGLSNYSYVFDDVENLHNETKNSRNDSLADSIRKINFNNDSIESDFSNYKKNRLSTKNSNSKEMKVFDFCSTIMSNFIMIIKL